LNVVGIVSAFAAEARHLGPTTTQRRGALGSLADGTLVVVSGIGGSAAADGARALIDAGATALISWGMAGGLDPALASGTIFLPSEVISRDGMAVMTARYWRERLSAALAVHCPVACGRLLTSSRAIGCAAAKAAAFRDTGAAAVDMESLAVAAVAGSHELPFIAVRVIVDTAADIVPQAVIAACGSSGHLRIARLIAALVLRPGDLAALIRLLPRYRAAGRSLRAAARAGTPARHAFPVVPDAVAS
jgi:adenosylhomocysteine nucleosidase